MGPARAIRTIGDIEAELDRITRTDPSERLPELEPGHALAPLVRAVNRSLDRLEYVVRQQSQFASDASHELRTPLTALRAEAEYAQMYPDDAELPRTLRTLVDGIDRLDGLVDDLLLLTRIGDPGTAPITRIDLGVLVADELARHGRLKDAGHELAVELEEGIEVDGVDSRLARAVANLLDNAERHARSTVTVTLRRSGSRAVLTVGDDGPGIPVEDRERVFDRFARLDTARDRQTGGTGLGLAISHNVAASHNGTLTVEDGPAPGANFIMELPLAPPP
ncbi:HAMP domain-containing sensor histidine kinase [Actinocorallia longicatena]|uniref:histidine kinase n=1 Tax=Actinocorallia longicatena TaxID=111803 RepID=A0ABP6QGF1_9ACTN